MGNEFAKALQSTRTTAAAAPRSGSNGRNSRKHIGGYFDPAVSRQLRLMAVEEDTTIQQLLEEALGLLFEARGKPVIARERPR